MLWVGAPQPTKTHWSITWIFSYCAALPAGQFNSWHHTERCAWRLQGLPHIFMFNGWSWKFENLIKSWKIIYVKWITRIWFTIFYLCLSYWSTLWIISASKSATFRGSPNRHLLMPKRPLTPSHTHLQILRTSFYNNREHVRFHE